MALSAARVAISAARRSYIGSFLSEVLDRNRQPEWFDMQPIPLLNKEKSYRLVQMIPYMTDLANWGKPEYFARASETVQRGAADCDDKAILLASFWYGLGLNPVVVVADTDLGGHAFLEMNNCVYDATWDEYEIPIQEYYEKHEVTPSFWFTDQFWGGYP